MMSNLVDIRAYLGNEPVYRLYGAQAKPSRLGCGTLFYAAGDRTRRAVDIDTYDYSASYILAGSITYTDHHGREFTAEQGDVFQRVPKYIHTTQTDPSRDFCEFFLLIAGPPTSHLMAIGIIEPEPIYRVGLRPDLIERLVRIRERLRSRESMWHLQAIAAMQEQILDYRRLAVNQADEEALQIHAARQALETDLSQSISIPELSEELGMGYETFRKWFRTHVGMSPGAYRIRSRINHALGLLANPTYTISDVARLAGYPDVYSFSKQFKHHSGQSPTDYRRSINL